MGMIAIRWLLAGLIATLTMDVGSAALRSTGLTAGLSPHLLGRWFAALARGGLGRRSILDAPASRGEVPLALVCHYLIGVGLTLAFLTLVRAIPSKPTPTAQIVLALGFGLATNVLPWLVMFPSMGFGLFGRGAPSALLLLRTSFVNHLFFGVGLALASCSLGLFSR
jgi:hypothetical protein